MIWESLYPILGSIRPHGLDPRCRLPDRPDPGRCLGEQSDAAGFSESLEGILGDGWRGWQILAISYQMGPPLPREVS